MQVVFVRQSEEQATIAAPVLHKRGNIETQVKGRLCFRPAREAPALNGVFVELLPGTPFVAIRGIESIQARHRPQSVSFGWFVGIVTILTRKGGRARRATRGASRLAHFHCHSRAFNERVAVIASTDAFGGFEGVGRGVLLGRSYGLAVLLRVGFRR